MMGGFRFERPRVRSGSADPLDFPLEHDPGGLVDAPAHFFGEAFDIGCRGAAGVDQEIGMLVRDHCPALRQTAAPGSIDEPPCRLARWVGKSRPRGARADWLGCLPRCADLHQPFCDLGALARDTAQPGLDEDPSGVDPAMAIGKRHRSAVDYMTAAAAVEGSRRNEHVPYLHAIGAGVHPQASADRAGDARQEFEPRKAGLCRGDGDKTVERTRADMDHSLRDGDASNTAAEPDRSAGNAGVAYQKVRAGADHRDRNFRRQGRPKPKSPCRSPRSRLADREPGEATPSAPMMAVRIARSCDTARRLQSSKLARQIVCPIGNRARPQAHNHVARPRQLADQRGKIAWIGEGSYIAMAVLDQTRDNGSSGHSLNRRLASGVDIRNQNDIGIVEARAETIEEVQYACETMRLNHRDHLAFDDRACRLQHRCDLDRGMSVLVDYGHRVPLARLA